MNKKLSKLQRAVLCALGVYVLFAISAGNLLAQYYNDPGLGQQPVASHPQDFKPLGVRAGAFMLHPGVQLGAQWTDNAFFSNDNEQSDTIFHVRPYITAQSTWSRHSLNVRLGADFARYDKYSERDYEDYFFSVTGRIDVKTRNFFSYGLDYMDLHEGLNNRSSQQGVKPTRYDLYGGYFGYDHTFNRLSLGVKFSKIWLDFDDVLGANNQIIDNQDRDRDLTTYSLRAAYQFAVDKQVFVTYTGYETEYDQQFDRNGYDRSGSGYSIDGGFYFSITDRFVGDIYARYYNRDFDDPRLHSDSGFLLGGGAGLEFHPTDLTTIRGSISSGIQETTDRNNTSYVQNLYSVRVDHELLRNVQINGFASYSINNYNPIDKTVEDRRTKDKISRIGAGASWFINRYMYLNASYDYETLDSSLPKDGYSANNVWLLLGLEY